MNKETIWAVMILSTTLLIGIVIGIVTMMLVPQEVLVEECVEQYYKMC